MELQKLIDGLKAHRNGAASYESVDEAIRVFETMLDVDGEKVCKALGQGFGNGVGNAISFKYPGMEKEYNVTTLLGDALALIRQQQERIAELEAADASWQKFVPFLYAHGLLNDVEGAQK